MWSGGFERPLAAPVEADPLLHRGVAALHLLAWAALLYPLALPAWARAGLALAVGLSLLSRHRARRRAAGPGGVAVLEWRGPGAWVMVLRDGRRLRARLRSRPVDSPALVIAAFDCADGRRRRLLLTPRTTPPEPLLRRLRVHLRQEALAETGAVPL